MADQENEMEKIESRLKSLEIRLARLESAISIHENADSFEDEEVLQPADPIILSGKINEEEKGLESRIGRFGLAWLGNIVLLFGISFLVQYLMILGLRYLSVLIGYIAAAAIFYMANYLRKTNGHLSFMFKINAQILLFYITLRLHFFSTSPVFTEITISLLILLIIVGLQVYMSIRDKSEVFAALSVIFALTAAIVSYETQLMLPIVILTAAGSVYYYFRFSWRTILIITIIFTYISFFLWMVGNPVMGHDMKLIAELRGGIIYFFGLGACYSFVLLFRKLKSPSDDFLTVVTFVNGIFFSIILLFVVLGFYSKNYVVLFSVITIF